VDCALTLIARGRQVNTVCKVLGVARSNVIERVKRLVDWSDGRKGRRALDDEALVAEIRAEVADLPTYGYRRACEFVRPRRCESACNTDSLRGGFRVEI
jgi:putative transposase